MEFEANNCSKMDTEVKYGDVLYYPGYNDSTQSNG